MMEERVSPILPFAEIQGEQTGARELFRQVNYLLHLLRMLVAFERKAGAINDFRIHLGYCSHDDQNYCNHVV